MSRTPLLPLALMVTIHACTSSDDGTDTDTDTLADTDEASDTDGPADTDVPPIEPGAGLVRAFTVEGHAVPLLLRLAVRRPD